MRVGFREHIRNNNRKLRFLLLLVFGLTAFAGHTLGVSFDRLWGDGAYYEAYGEPFDGTARQPWYRDYPNQLAVALVLLVFVQYLRIRRRGAWTLLSLVGGRRLRDLQLRNVTSEISLAAGIRAPSLYVVNDASLNAFACGLGERTAVVVTSGLLERLDRDELQGVVAHEIGHIRNGDTTLMTVMFGMARVLRMTAAFAFGPLVAIVANARDPNRNDESWPARQRERIKARLPKGPFTTKTKVLFALGAPILGIAVMAVGLAFSILVMFVFTTLIRYLPWIALALAAWELWKLAGHEEREPKKKRPGPLGLLIFAPVGLVAGSAILLLGAVFPFVLLLLRLSVSRNQEFTADASAVELTRNPDGLVEALRKLRDDATKATAMPRSVTPLAIAPIGDRKRAPVAFLRRLRELFSTHPSLDERIARLMEMGAGPPTREREAAPVPARVS